MIQLKIKNFGPIKKGYTESSDGFFEINKLSLFIGNQGTGKSCIAKIYSTFVWLEKKFSKTALITEKNYNIDFFLSLLKFHKIDSFYSENSILEYRGDWIDFSVSNNNLSFKFKNKDNYILPKIQYIPAERNLVSNIEKYEQIPYLSDSMQDFMFTYDLAIQSDFLQSKELPINELKIRYNRTNHKVELYNSDYLISLSESSSGLQSFVPYYATIKYLTNEIFNPNSPLTFKNLEERKKFERKFVQDLGYNPDSDIELMEYAKKVSKTEFNSCLVTILEEPEQNLYPDSQKNMIFDLLKTLNISDSNKLLLTTHSPYLIPYINVATKGYELLKNEDIKISEIDRNSFIASDDVVFYELVDGKIKKLMKIKNIANDDNLLNNELDNTNELYRKILKAGLCK